jgi:hypothetical protein
MAAAVTYIGIFSSAATTPSASSGETTGLCFNSSDSRSGTASPIAIPTTTSGTAYSYNKYFALTVATTGTTTINNRMVARSSAAPAGLILYWATTSIYVQPTTAVATNTTADDVDPDGATTGWTALTTTYVAYSTADAAPTAGTNGNYAKIILGVSSTGTYTGGPGTAIVLPNIIWQYDEV